MRRFRCWQCLRIVQHVNSSHTCDRCVNAGRAAARRSREAGVRRINGDWGAK